MGIEVKKLRNKQHKVAFAFSSKERADYSQKTIAPLLAEKDFDVYWIDGSVSDEARALPLKYAEAPQLCEVHLGVRGGADAAIVYSLSLLLDKGYDYIGLIENDVHLQPGWWPRIWNLFEQGKKDGVKVGGVSARCYKGRMHIPRDGYALMYDVGAGMGLYTREAVMAILDGYRTGTLGEISFVFAHYTGKPIPVHWQMAEGQPNTDLPTHPQTADWFFRPNTITRGLVMLAPTPTLSVNLDGDGPYVPQTEATKADPAFEWEKFCAHLRVMAKREQEGVRNIIANYDPALKNWRTFPHQIITALPGAFQGKWKLKWTKSLGPFSMVTGEAGACLRLPMHGLVFGIMLDSYAKPLTLTIRGKFGEGKLKIAEKPGWQWANIHFPNSGPYELEILFDQADILIGYLVFEGPQSWFKSAYNLRYSDLRPFLETG